MNKIITIIIFLIIIFNIGCSNNYSIPDVKINNLKGKVKSITETEFFGSDIEQNIFKKVIHYNKNGYIKKIDNYNFIDEDTLKIGEYILYDNNISDRKSYKVNTENDTLEIVSYKYYKNKVTVNFKSLKGLYSSKVIHELNDSNNSLKKHTTANNGDEILLDNVLIQHFKANTEIDYYTIEDKLANSTKTVKLENTFYDEQGNILTFTINESPTSSYTVTKVYEYYK